MLFVVMPLQPPAVVLPLRRFHAVSPARIAQPALANERFHVCLGITAADRGQSSLRKQSKRAENILNERWRQHDVVVNPQDNVDTARNCVHRTLMTVCTAVGVYNPDFVPTSPDELEEG